MLSPQFLIWLLPLVPAVAGAGGLAACAVLLVSLVTTQLWFPFRYWDVVALEPVGWLVVVRDLLLVALYAILLSRARTLRSVDGDAEGLASRSAAVGVAVDHGALDANAALGGMEADRHGPSAFARSRARPRTPMTESCGPVMPASVIAAVPPRLHAGVVRLHVRVRADHRGHPSVEHARERDLLARGLRVEVDEDDLCAPRACSTSSSTMRNGLLGDVEEERALEVDNGDRRHRARLTTVRPLPGPVEVAGPDDATALLEDRDDVLLSPDVVAQS